MSPNSPPAPKKRMMSKTVTIGTHNGRFHCDEVLACSMLQLLPEYENAEIIRTRDPSKLDLCDIVVDVGRVFDPKKHRYDHHQKSFTESVSSLLAGKKYVTKLSSAGLVYCHFGKRILAQLLKVNMEDPKVDSVFDKVYEGFMEEIDAIDNGISTHDGPPRYLLTTSLSSRVGHLNPNWNEPTNDLKVRSKFEEAMKLTSTEFLDRINYFTNIWWPAREVVEKALRLRKTVDQSGEIVDLGSSSCPWKEHLFDLEKEMDIDVPIKYVIYQDSTNDTWRIQCVPVNVGSFENRLSLPKAWQGLRDEELSKEMNSPGAIFVHANGFIGGHSNRDGVLLMAQKAINFK